MNYKFQWVVNPYRKDKRTGVINPVQMSKWAKYLMDKEIKRLRGLK